jgi:hypothetical protein
VACAVARLFADGEPIGVEYVTSPIKGDIIAVLADSGRVLWRAEVRAARASMPVAPVAVLAATQSAGFDS